MTDNLENQFGNIVDLLYVFIRRIAENVFSQDAELLLKHKVKYIWKNRLLKNTL